jgi:hypothetical protein
MKNSLRALAFLAALLPSWALAQSAPAVMPYHTVYGRLGAAPGDTGPGQAIPFATLIPQLFTGFCTTSNALLSYSTAQGKWVCVSTLPTSQIPAFAGGDVTGAGGSLVLSIGANKVTLGMLATLAADKLIGSGAAGTPSAVSLTNCLTALTYNTTTHVFGCAVPVTSVGITPSASLSVSGSPVTSSGNITVTYRPPTMQFFPGSATATYTTPANVSAIKVTLCGATGGGSGSGTGTTGGTGGTPTASTFSGGTLSCAGGGGATASAAGTGATCTGAGAAIFAGKDGQGVFTGIAGQFTAGPLGGSTPFVGTSGGRGGVFNGAGNTGAGGGGAGCAVQYIPSPAATYSYALQSGGAAGTAGTSGVVGIIGDPAKLIVEEF